MDYGKAKLVQIQVCLDNEGTHAHSMWVWAATREINPIVDINCNMPEGYMHYVLSLIQLKVVP